MLTAFIAPWKGITVIAGVVSRLRISGMGRVRGIDGVVWLRLAVDLDVVVKVVKGKSGYSHISADFESVNAVDGKTMFEGEGSSIDIDLKSSG